MSWGTKNAIDQLNYLQKEIATLRGAVEELGVKVDLIDGVWVEIEIKKEETANDSSTSNKPNQK